MKDLYNENFLSASFHSNPRGGGGTIKFICKDKTLQRPKSIQIKQNDGDVT